MDAFGRMREVCCDLGINKGARNYTSFMDGLTRYGSTFRTHLNRRFQALSESSAGRFWRDGGWVLMGFDGSRITAPRTVSNEKEFCASNYGSGQTAKYRKKKSKGMRRRKNEKAPPQPRGPQVWITKVWHMGLRLPWTWRLGPSNSSERGHVEEILAQEEFPPNTLFCGDAGFVGHSLWKAIKNAKADFIVRVGGNVSLYCERSDLERISSTTVLCWPQEQRNSGKPPLHLRLLRITIGKTKTWLLTSVMDRKKLTKRQAIKFYKMRWGIEVEFRGLKQTLDKRHLRCRNAERAYVELDWCIRSMAIAELLAVREQIAKAEASDVDSESSYNTKDRSLANTMRNSHLPSQPQSVHPRQRQPLAPIVMGRRAEVQARHQQAGKIPAEESR